MKKIFVNIWRTVMNKEYLITKVVDDIVTLEDIVEKTSKDCSFEELTNIAVDNLVVGFNRITGSLKVSTLQDYVKYKISKAKLLGKGTKINISCDVSANTRYKGIMGTKATYIVEDNCLRVTVSESEEIRTDGVLVVSSKIISANKIKHIIFDIPTYCYNYIYFDTPKMPFVESVSFTERCNFEGIKGINQLLYNLPKLKNVDMSNLNFDSVTDFEFFFNATNIEESCETNIIFPKLTVNSKSGTDIRSYKVMQKSILNYSALEFLLSILTAKNTVDLGIYHYMLQIPEENYIDYLKLCERLAECLKVTDPEIEDGAYKMLRIEKLIVPYTEDIINNLDLRSIFTADKGHVNIIIIDMTKGKIEFPTKALKTFSKVLQLEKGCLSYAVMETKVYLYYKDIPVKSSENVLSHIIKAEEITEGTVVDETLHDLHYFDNFVDNTMLDNISERNRQPQININTSPENLLVAVYMLNTYRMKRYPYDLIKIKLIASEEILTTFEECKEEWL